MDFLNGLIDARFLKNKKKNSKEGIFDHEIIFGAWARVPKL
jgi:hypothetical protein